VTKTNGNLGQIVNVAIYLGGTSLADTELISAILFGS